MGETKIQWTDATWNPTRGCSLVSAGCTNCYAMKQAHRFSGKRGAYEGLTRMTSNGPVWTGEVRLAEDKLEEPLRWKKPRRVFVNSMSDLFHESLSTESILRVFEVMAYAKRHTFQVLTKRPERMNYLLHYPDDGKFHGDSAEHHRLLMTQPLSNVWLGVSVENQESLSRIDVLRNVPAALRFVSFEPLLQDLGTINLEGIRWAIIGGESGPGARPFNVQWARDVIAQCEAAGVKCFIKQLGAKPSSSIPCNIECQCGLHYGFKDKKGGLMEEWPEDIRIREFPTVSSREEKALCMNQDS